MADTNFPASLEDLKVKFGYTVGSTYTWDQSKIPENEIVFVQTGTDDGVIYVADKQFGISKTDYEKLVSQINAITGTDGETIDLSGIAERLVELEEQTGTTLPNLIATTNASLAEAFNNTLGQINGANFGTSNTVANAITAAIASATAHVKSITLNNVPFTNSEGDWSATIDPANIIIATAITGASSGLDIAANTDVYNAIKGINDRVDVLIGSTNLAETFDTIVEISEYLETNGASILGNITSIQASVDDHEDRIDALEGTVLAQGTSINNIEGDLATVIPAVQSLQTDLSAATATINNIISLNAQQDTTKYINGITIGNDGLISLASSDLNATAVAFTPATAGTFDGATTVQGALISLSETIAAEQAAGVRTLSTEGLVDNLSNASGNPTLILFGTTIQLGDASNITGTPLIELNDASTIAENIAVLNTETYNAIATINATIDSLVRENLTWHYFGSRSENNG